MGRVKKYLMRLLAIGVAVMPIAGTPLLGVGIAHATSSNPELISISSSGDPSDGGSGSLGVGGNQISSDGRYVAFASDAQNLNPQRTGENITSIYVRDRQTGITSLESVGSEGQQENGNIARFILSGDGRHLAFMSNATNLDARVTDPTAIYSNVYVRNLDTGVTSLASLDPNGNIFVSYGSTNPAIGISNDGSLVTFSGAYNFYGAKIYIRDLNTNVTSELPRGVEPQVAGDGRYVAYTGFDGAKYVFDRVFGTSAAASVSPGGDVIGVAGDGTVRGISDDGRYVIFEGGASIMPGYYPSCCSRIFRRDMQTDTTQRVDVATGGATAPGPGYSNAAAISGDGNTVVFQSSLLAMTTDAVPDGIAQLYEHNFTTGLTQLVSVNALGEATDGLSGSIPSINYDGSYVAYSGQATNLGVTSNYPQMYLGSVVPRVLGHVSAPILGSYSVNSKWASQPEAFAVPVGGGGSEAAMGEFYAGADPGYGNGTPMFSADGQLTGTIGTDLEAGTYQLTVRAIDADGNWSQPQVATLVVGDIVAPIVNSLQWSANPVASTNGTTLSLVTTAGSSAILAGEYYIDNPELTNGRHFSRQNDDTLFAQVGPGLTPGIHTIGARVLSSAGTWSDATTDYLVVYDPAKTKVTGQGAVVPVLGLDILPGLAGAGQLDKAKFGLAVVYKNGRINTTKSLLSFTYETGTRCNGQHPSNCHITTMSSTSMDWAVADGENNSHSTVQGVATVTIDGVTTNNPYRVEAMDGALVNPNALDHFVLKIFAPGANPNTATPIYQVGEDLVKGNIKVVAPIPSGGGNQ